MEVKFDNELVEQWLSELQTEGKIKYCKIDKVKIRNNVTRCQNLVRDIYIFATNQCSNKPYVVMGIAKDNNYYMVHQDLTHWNVSNSLDRYDAGNGIVIYYKIFCNPCLQYHIWENPEVASKILKGNLMEGNPNDRYRTPDSVDQDKYCPPLFYVNFGERIKDKVNLLQFFSRSPRGEMTREQTIVYNELLQKLKGDHNLVYCYCSPISVSVSDWTRRTIRRSQIGTEYFVSDYYKTYDYRNCEEELEIEPISIDVACVGCGSAGSNIIDQTVRLNYFKNYLLVDFDCIEEKNLRNQCYNESDVGNTKVSALGRIMKAIHRHLNVMTECKKYEEVFWDQYKSKYTISGFDSIDCRLGLLDKVTNGNLKTKYIIDARYDGLNASLFFIDTENEDEVKYYSQLLEADKKEFEILSAPLPASEWTLESLQRYCNDNHILTSNCSQFGQDLGYNTKVCLCRNRGYLDCGSTECLNCLLDAVREKEFPMPREYQQSTCIAENIVHIYKLVSSWVVANIRSIESGEGKLYTHVDITAEPLPNAMVLRK